MYKWSEHDDSRYWLGEQVLMKWSGFYIISSELLRCGVNSTGYGASFDVVERTLAGIERVTMRWRMLVHLRTNF